jgi:hypothetical protein
MTITANFSGNLGNHLVAYLITRVIADKNNYKFGFNRYPEYDYYNGQSQLDFMDLDYGHEHNYKYAETPPWVTNIYQEKYETFNYPNGDNVEFQNYQPEVFDIPDNTKIIVRSFQDARYYRGYRNKIQEWTKIKEDFAARCSDFMTNNGILFDDDTCYLNIRGGEYRGVPQLILRKQYWDDAMRRMLDRNPNMKFKIVTDDPPYANSLFSGTIPVIHLGIGGDYVILNSARNLILSNSSFAIFPAWLNKNDPYVIAPFGWARHNVTFGYWAGADMSYYPWNFMDREGNLIKGVYDYE